MKEFDQCPGCKTDLLLENPESENNELRCLGCGYTCQPTEASPDARLPRRFEETTEYWQRRCAAAENALESMELSPEQKHAAAYQDWLAIKAGNDRA